MWRDDARLLDMLLAAIRVKGFLSGVTWEEFQQSELHQHAVMKALEIIGEAARNVSDDVKTAHPEIPWPDIVSMRNRLIHEYFRLDVRKIWDTAERDIPALIGLLEPLVPPEQP